MNRMHIKWRLHWFWGVAGRQNASEAGSEPHLFVLVLMSKDAVISGIFASRYRKCLYSASWLIATHSASILMKAATSPEKLVFWKLIELSPSVWAASSACIPFNYLTFSFFQPIISLLRLIFLVLFFLSNGMMVAASARAFDSASSTIRVTVTNFASNFCFSALLSYIFFMEYITFAWYLGSALMVMGIFLISYGMPP